MGDNVSLIRLNFQQSIFTIMETQERQFVTKK
jgi:hypothetical protein